MLNQLRDKIETVNAGDIIRLHGRIVVVGREPVVVVLPYKGEIHSAVEIIGWDARGLHAVRTLVVPDQHVTIIR